MAATIKIEVVTSGGVDKVKQEIASIGSAAEKAGGGFSSMREIATGALREVGAMATNLAAGGLMAIGNGLLGAAQTGFSFNNSMEQVTAKLNAFTKDGAKSAEILEMIKDRASKTPFEFEAMAQATAALLPTSKASGVALEELIQKAEILAASNPAEGLEGAAFALKEAVSGDFTSIIERFNLPRQYINELKDQGVPALEAVGMAMQQLGLDADLVTNMAGTMEGRWSTLKDTFTDLAGTLTQPLFEMASDSLAELQPMLDAAMPMLKEMATAFGQDLKNAITTIATDVIPALISAWNTIQPAIAVILPLFTGELPASLLTTGATFDQLQSTINTVMAGIQAIISAVLPQITAFWQAHGADIMATAQETWNRISEIVRTALALIQAILGPALQAIASFINSHGAEIQAILSNTWNAIKAVIDIALTLIQGVLKAALQIIQGDWSGAWNTIQQMCARIVMDIGTIIQSGVNNIITIFGGMATSVISTLQGLANDAIALGSNIVQGIISGVRAAASSLMSTLRGLASDALSAAKSALGISSPSDAFADFVGVPIVQGIVQGIKQTTGQLLTTMAGVAGQAVNYTSDLVRGMSDVVLGSGLGRDGEQIGADLLAGLVAGIKDNIRSVTDIVNSTANTVKEAFQGALGISSPSTVFADEVGKPIMQGLIQGIEGMIPGLESVLGSVYQYIIERARKVNDKVRDEAEKLQQDLLDRAAGLQDKLSNIMADSLTGAASLDRAKAKAIAALKDITAAQQEEVQKQLAQAANTAAGFGDPTQAAKFFKMRSDQIFELAKLRDQIEKSTDEAAKARLIEQYNLIGKAQQSELQAFDTKGGSSALLGITQQLQEIFSKNPIGQFDDPTGVLGQLFNALPQLIAMSSGANNPSAANTTNSTSFTYAPNITTTAPPPPVLDRGIAAALARV